MTTHDHPADGDCQPTCPGWAEGALELYALQRRHDAMLAACQAADHVEFVVVAPGTPGAELPESLHGQDLVRLNLVVGRDCPEVLLDEWGIRVNLTFRGRRHDCAIPWAAVLAGVLVPQPRKRPRFGLVTGGGETGAASAPGSGPTALPPPASATEPMAAPPAPPEPPAVSSPALPARPSKPAPPIQRVPPPPALAPQPGEPAPATEPAPPPRPRVPFGVIRGGKDDREP